MAEVADHLVPSDGLTRARLEFVGIDYPPGGKVTVRFGLTDAEGQYAGIFTVAPDVAKGEAMEMIVAAAHREMRDILREWLYRVDIYATAFERGSRPTT